MLTEFLRASVAYGSGLNELMDTFHTIRRKTLDMMCQMASFVLERAGRRESDLSSAIGVRSRGVLIVGGQFSGVFEKGAVLCRKGFRGNTATKRVAATQVKWQAGSYGEETRKKKMLTRDACETGWSSVNWWKTERKCFLNLGQKNVPTVGVANRRKLCAHKTLRFSSEFGCSNRNWTRMFDLCQSGKDTRGVWMVGV